MKPNITKKILGFSGVGLVFGIVLAANIVLLSPSIEKTLSAFLSTQYVDEEALELSRNQGQVLAKEIEGEGAVLVKNNGVLPLSKSINKVNVLGRSSADWIYGGAGSGRTIPEFTGAKQYGIVEALKDYDIQINEPLHSMYKSYYAAQGSTNLLHTTVENFYRIGDPSISEYSADLKNGIESFSDTAIVVISRKAGESGDCPRAQYKFKQATDTSRHYLEISTEEEELLKYAGEKHENVIVVVNSTNVMELDFLETIPNIDACLWVGSTGNYGALAIPEIIYGDINPSAKVVDAFAYDINDNINNNLTGYEGMSHYLDATDVWPVNTTKKPNSKPSRNTWTGPHYFEYSEGIYVGYKWYETADAEGYWNGRTREVLDSQNQKITKTNYDAVVQYPFGYGLSYTSFDWDVENVTPALNSNITDKTEISIKVKVTNVGEVPGKDVVELYSTPTYYDDEIEKSHVNLVAFGKTENIKPGEYQILELKLTGYDLASYDCYDLNKNTFAGYELDRGNYQLKLMTDSHNLKEMDKADDAIITYNVPNTIKIEKDPVTGNVVNNKFTGEDAIDGISLDAKDLGQNINFISRNAFPEKLEKSTPIKMPEILKSIASYDNGDATAWNNATTDNFGNEVDLTKTITWGANNNKKLWDNGVVTSLGLELGADFDSEKWEEVLDQVNRSEATSIMLATYGSKALASVGKGESVDLDGPSQVGSYPPSNPRKKGTGFPSAFVIAQTWNKDLAYDMGLSYASDMVSLGITGAYGPGCNIHRSPFGGRNFEYYSEDGFISGVMISNQVKGIQNGGKYAFVKHFALAEQDNYREGYFSWVTEQALREVYLKPFQMAVQRGGAVGIMTSFNRVGSTWAGGSEALMVGVLRSEWGFDGAVITDYVETSSYMNPNQCIRVGGALSIAGSLSGGYSNNGSRFDQALRYGIKTILYMHLRVLYQNQQYLKNPDDQNKVVVGSSNVPTWVWWKDLLIDLNILTFAGCSFWVYKLIVNKPKKEEGEN